MFHAAPNELSINILLLILATMSVQCLSLSIMQNYKIMQNIMQNKTTRFFGLLIGTNTFLTIFVQRTLSIYCHNFILATVFHMHTLKLTLFMSCVWVVIRLTRNQFTFDSQEFTEIREFVNLFELRCFIWMSALVSGQREITKYLFVPEFMWSSLAV